MREIKFRAWDETFQEMSEPFQIGSELSMRWGGDNLMQFTGLKDRNGVEIYEGDVLGAVCINNTIANAEVIFRGGSFQVRHHTGEKMAIDLWDVAHTCEVIGNVFENAELIQAQAATAPN